MRLIPDDLKMQQILRVSDNLTLLVGFDPKTEEVVIATGKGSLDDFIVREYIAIPVEAARSIPSFIQDFLTSWDTSHASGRLRKFLDMEEAASQMRGKASLSGQRTAILGGKAAFEERCEICGRKVSTESTVGWFKLYRGDRVIWVCPNHDAREATFFAQKE